MLEYRTRKKLPASAGLITYYKACIDKEVGENFVTYDIEYGTVPCDMHIFHK